MDIVTKREKRGFPSPWPMHGEARPFLGCHGRADRHLLEAGPLENIATRLLF